MNTDFENIVGPDAGTAPVSESGLYAAARPGALASCEAALHTVVRQSLARQMETMQFCYQNRIQLRIAALNVWNRAGMSLHCTRLRCSGWHRVNLHAS